MQALDTLQCVELCHRDVSLQNVLLHGTRCTLMNLSCALRIPTDPGSGVPRMIEPQPPCASNPQTVAPELLRNEPFDGYAVDLWAAGVVLFTMLLGADALFAAPVVEDRKFRMICEGNLRQLVMEIQEAHAALANQADPSAAEAGKPPLGLSDSAIDLLQQMLRPEPRARLTLSQVLSHEWVTAAGTDGSGTPGAPAGVPFVPTRRFSSHVTED
jgi:serine/threonine protein kinase